MMKKTNKPVKKVEKAPAGIPKYIATYKYNMWVKCFRDEKDKETYRNATKSAMRVYNTERINSAVVIGLENLRRLKNLQEKEST